MGISGISVDPYASASLQTGAASKVSRIDTSDTLRVSNPRLSAIIGDSVEVSDAAKWVSAAFEDFSNADGILRKSGDTLQMFSDEYTRRRNLIIEAGHADESFKAKQAQLLEALDAEMSKRVSSFADDSVALIGKMAVSVSAGDKEMVASGWVEGYRGSEGLSLHKSEADGIKADIEQVFAAVMKDAGNPGWTQQTVVKGKYLGSADFYSSEGSWTGGSFYSRLDHALNNITGKQRISSNMQSNEADERVNRPINSERAAQSSAAWATGRVDIRMFQASWQSNIVDLQDTSAVDKFSGGLKNILSRFDSVASVHKSHTDLLEMPDETIAPVIMRATDAMDEKVITEGVKAFEKYATRIENLGQMLSAKQKTLLGVMYLDAEALGTENALQKVDAFAKALATNNFYGFKLAAPGNPKNLNLLHLLEWFKEDKATIVATKGKLPLKLTVDEQKALITQQYLPHLVKANEITQRFLDDALAKQGKTE